MLPSGRAGEPYERLITGHGFETALRGRLAAESERALRPALDAFGYE